MDSDHIFLDKVFEELYSKRALIILAQKDRIDELSVPKIIEQRLKQRFGAQNTYFLIPLSGTTVEPQAYFSYLAQQLNVPDSIHIHTHSDLESALERRLQSDKSLFLFIRHVEKGDGNRANELAGLLRNLLEKTNLQILLLGDQKLAELRYGKGRSSVLSGITVQQWPELTVQDVQQRYPDLDAEQAQTFLSLSGGHPKLIEECWHYFQQRVLISDYAERLSKSSSLADTFMQFTDSLIETRQICQWLSQENLGPTETYIRDDLLRQLYWRNLLVVEQDEQLVWRCEAIRKAGQRILACSNQSF